MDPLLTTKLHYFLPDSMFIIFLVFKFTIYILVHTYMFVGETLE
jgi:hypothetical protein